MFGFDLFMSLDFWRFRVGICGGFGIEWGSGGGGIRSGDLDCNNLVSRLVGMYW